MERTRPLHVEQLEDRCVPVTWGNPWPDALHLTVSFTPDGTSVAGRPSVLFKEMNEQTTSSGVWQQEILRALQTWAVQGNINIGVVSDDGTALGAAGRPQGDTRFGDIRISMIDMSPDVIAIGSPFDITTGSWSGDIRLNSRYSFGVDGNGDYDLYTVLLHESAHVFGLDHSTDARSAVFEDYVQRNTYGLIASDIANIQALYGARGNDPFEGSGGNNTKATASSLSLLQNYDGSLGIAAEGDLRTSSDVDWYRFQAPLNLGGFAVRLKTQGVSQLAARVTVYDSLGKSIGAKAAIDPNTGDLVINVPTALPLLNTYYVKVEANRSDSFGVGSYQLSVANSPLVQTLTGLVQTTTQTVTGLLNDDMHTNDNFVTSLLLGKTVTQADSRFDYGFKGSIRDKSDVDFYRIQAPQSASGTSTMTAMVWGLQNNSLQPRVSVYDAQQNLVEAEVIVNENGVFTVQVRNARAGATYYIKVEASDPSGTNNVGNYYLGVDFGQQAVELTTLVDRTLTAKDTQDVGVIQIQEAQQLDLVLQATAVKGAVAYVEMTIFDSHGRIVGETTAANGKDAVTLNVTLDRGNYYVRFRAFNASGTLLPDVRYTLKATSGSDPIGPRTEDPTSKPAGTPPPAESTTTSPSSGGYMSPTSTSDSSRTGTSDETTYYYNYSDSYYYGTNDPYNPYGRTYYGDPYYSQPYHGYEEPAGNSYHTTSADGATTDSSSTASNSSSSTTSSSTAPSDSPPSDSSTTDPYGPRQPAYA